MEGIYTLTERTWRTVDGRGVPEGHADAAFLVGNAGTRITAADAQALGLIDRSSRIDPAPDLAERKRTAANFKKLTRLMNGMSILDPTFREMEEQIVRLAELARQNGFEISTGDMLDLGLIRRPHLRPVCSRQNLPRRHELTHQPRSSSPRARTSTTAGRDDGEDDDPDPDHPDPFGSAPTGAPDDDELVAQLMAAIDRWERGL